MVCIKAWKFWTAAVSSKLDHFDLTYCLGEPKYWVSATEKAAFLKV
jgi:hypothetical protein